MIDLWLDAHNFLHINTRRDRSRRIRDEATACKPEVEIWRRLDYLTRRPRLPVRPPIHQSVYLAPL